MAPLPTFWRLLFDGWMRYALCDGERLVGELVVDPRTALLGLSATGAFRFLYPSEESSLLFRAVSILFILRSGTESGQRICVDFVCSAKRSRLFQNFPFQRRTFPWQTWERNDTGNHKQAVARTRETTDAQNRQHAESRPREVTHTKNQKHM